MEENCVERKNGSVRVHTCDNYQRPLLRSSRCNAALMARCTHTRDEPEGTYAGASILAVCIRDMHIVDIKCWWKLTYEIFRSWYLRNYAIDVAVRNSFWTIAPRTRITGSICTEKAHDDDTTVCSSCMKALKCSYRTENEDKRSHYGGFCSSEAFEPWVMVTSEGVITNRRFAPYFGLWKTSSDRSSFIIVKI